MSNVPHRAALLALESSTDDLFRAAERSASFRELFLLALALLADRERRLTLARECHRRLRDENRELRRYLMEQDAA
jgi:hypothetical protein